LVFCSSKGFIGTLPNSSSGFGVGFGKGAGGLSTEERKELRRSSSLGAGGCPFL